MGVLSRLVSIWRLCRSGRGAIRGWSLIGRLRRKIKARRSMRGYACRGLTHAVRRPGCNSQRLHHFFQVDKGRRLSTTETEKSYLAGLIDGEGSVTLSRAHRNEMPSPHITITNTNRSVVRWAEQVTGYGKIISRRARRVNHKPAYIWCVAKAGRCLNLLREIRPYLRVKHRQADLILQRYKAVTPRNGQYTATLLKRKLRLVARIRALNHR